MIRQFAGGKYFGRSKFNSRNLHKMSLLCQLDFYTIGATGRHNQPALSS
jgi:hypothetical protein